MKLNFNKTFKTALSLLVLSLALTSCTFNFGNSKSPGNQGMMGPGNNTSGFSGSDIMFAQMMIPHHQQAVDMGTLAETRAFSSEVKVLAAKIKAEQAPEIIQMTEWLDRSNASLDMGHDMGMGGMLSESEMITLANTTGREFDRLFLEGMIVHHEGAIHMAQMVIDSNNAEARALGRAIIDSQTEQITYMKQLLLKL